MSEEASDAAPAVDDEDARGNNAGGKRTATTPAADDAEAPGPTAAHRHDYENDDEYLHSQVRIDGFPKYSTKKLVEQRLMRNIGVVGIRRVKKQNNQDFAFVYFESKAARYEGAASSSCARGGGGSADVAAPLRNAEDVVTPLHAMPYSEQLVRKRRGLVEALLKLPKEMKDASRGLPEDAKAKFKALPWLQPGAIAATGPEGLAVPLAEVTPARLTHGYRNKCEFSFGRDAEGKPCLGFQLGQIKLVGSIIGPPDACPNVSDAMKAAVARIQTFVMGSSLPPYNKMDGSGFWRQVTARQAFNPPPPPHPNSPAAIQAARARAERGDTEPALPADATPLLLVFLVAKRAAAAAEVDAEMARLVEFLTGPAAMASYPMPLRLSVAVESADARGEAAAGDNAAGLQQLYGPAYIEERLHGLTYRVSPAAFFQVNTPGAEQLCELLQTVCAVGPKTVLLDVCCGTGTLGLSLARSVQKVVGVEICVPAVKDARANAGRNRVTNASFIASKAEHAIKGVLESLTDDEKANLVAIVDPPRAGLHHDVIKALRACLPLTKLIFIACHAPAFVANAAPLCRPTSTSFAGPPFAPTQAHALDLFPHTAHCELIVVLERSAPPPSEPPPSEPHAAPQPGEGSTSGTTGGGMAQESAHGTARDAAGEAEMVE